MMTQMAQEEKMTFGIAFSRIGMAPSGIRDYLDFDEFTAMELPWETFAAPDPDAKELLRMVNQKEKKILCGAVMDSRLSRSITFAEDKFQKDFSRQLAKALKFLASCGIRTATLDCPLENFLGSHEAQEDMRRILLGAAPVLQQEKMTLLLPCGIPAACPLSAAMKFMRNTMMPGLKLRLDVMPWHPDCTKTPLRTLLGQLPLETRAVTFKYDADCGNRIMKEQVKVLLTVLKRTNFTGTVMLAPMSIRNRMAFPEANQFSEILKELRDFIES